MTGACCKLFAAVDSNVGEEKVVSEEDLPIASTTHGLGKRVADPHGRLQFVAIGRIVKNRVVTTLATTITTKSAISYGLKRDSEHSTYII
jgi:hypothetical protein